MVKKSLHDWCEFEECSRIAVIGLLAHTHSDALLNTNTKFFCREHWWAPCREAAQDMLRGGAIKGISIVLP